MARPRKTTNARGDSEWMRERLLDAAEHLIAHHGYEGASLRDIGLRVGVSNATLLHHFGSKLALYRAVLDRFAIALRGLVDSVAADPSEDAPAALVRFLDRFTAWTRENRSYCQIAFREFMDRVALESHVDVHLEAGIIARLAEIVRRGQSDGAFRTDVDVEALVVQMITTVWSAEVSSATFGYILERDADALRAVATRQGVEGLLRALMIERRTEPVAVAVAAPATLQ
jgi:AcrR family transcriptional regulator